MTALFRRLGETLALGRFVVEDSPMKKPLEVIAMHGWAGDARCWEVWRTSTEPLGWRWQAGERGYGELAPRSVSWKAQGNSPMRRLVIGHPLGPHLVQSDVLCRAEAIVLLASFGTFAPPGRGGRRARAMLTSFMQRVAEPQSPDLLPPRPLDGPLDAASNCSVRTDLDPARTLQQLAGRLPARRARVLIVETVEDRIVEPATLVRLREALLEADVIKLPGVGDALLAGHVSGRVVEWVEAWRGDRKVEAAGTPLLLFAKTATRSRGRSRADKSRRRAR
jgi:pimeloyl-[acyl-carrier protein] methyl ester esterase